MARSSDGHLDVRLSTPGGMCIGSNPEQLLAAGWSACFESAMGLLARKKKITLPPDISIDAELGLNIIDGGYFLRVFDEPLQAQAGTRRAQRTSIDASRNIQIC